MAPEPPGTRAVRRLIRAGNDHRCSRCGEWVKFRARHRDYQVIANVYKRRRWDRLEVWHEACFEAAGRPVSPYVIGEETELGGSQ